MPRPSGSDTKKAVKQKKNPASAAAQKMSAKCTMTVTFDAPQKQKTNNKQKEKKAAPKKATPKKSSSAVQRKTTPVVKKRAAVSSKTTGKAGAKNKQGTTSKKQKQPEIHYHFHTAAPATTVRETKPECQPAPALPYTYQPMGAPKKPTVEDYMQALDPSTSSSSSMVFVGKRTNTFHRGFF